MEVGRCADRSGNEPPLIATLRYVRWPGPREELGLATWADFEVPLLIWRAREGRCFTSTARRWDI